MPRVEPLRALHYDPAVAGPLQALAAPPYDVIDPEQRAELQPRSPYNVVAIDLPEDPDGGDRYAHAATLLERVARRRRGRPRRRARDLGARPGVHRPRRPPPDAQRLLRARARRGLRPRRDPPARAHAPRPEGRPPQPHAARPRPTSRRSSRCTPTPTSRLARARAGDQQERAVRRVHRRRRHAQPPLARDGPAGVVATVDRSDERGRAADRRRPPPLRDRARLRRGDRRRGRAPLRPDVPRRAAGRGPHGLPDAPPRRRPHGHRTRSRR